MAWLESVWAVIGPYVLEGCQWLVNTGVGVGIGSWLVKKWSKKYDDKNIADTISTNVVSGIAGKNVLVSLESTNKAQLNQIKADLLKEFSSAFESIKMQNDVLSAMSKIMIRFKASTESEKAELVNAINKIEAKSNVALTTEVESEPVVVKIEPVATSDEKLF